MKRHLHRTVRWLALTAASTCASSIALAQVHASEPEAPPPAEPDSHEDDAPPQVGVGATYGPYTLSEWSGIGIFASVEADWRLARHWVVGLRGEHFDGGSLSSDKANYDRQVSKGSGGGTYARFQLRPTKTFDPFATGRIQFLASTRGQPAAETSHQTLAVGAEVGLSVHLGPISLGILYSIDAPLFEKIEFGGTRLPTFIPQLRIGARF